MLNYRVLNISWIQVFDNIGFAHILAFFQFFMNAKFYKTLFSSLSFEVMILFSQSFTTAYDIKVLPNFGSSLKFLA